MEYDSPSEHKIRTIRVGKFNINYVNSIEKIQNEGNLQQIVFKKKIDLNLCPAPHGGLCLLSDINEDFPEDLGQFSRSFL